jgi:hypothetical protein
MKDDGYFRSINHGSCWYKDDPFILSTQATKVFYLDALNTVKAGELFKSLHIGTYGMSLKMKMRKHPWAWDYHTKTKHVQVFMYK